MSTGEASRGAERPSVLITRDGVVIIAGREFAESDWREGKSGSGVLRRFFRVLLSAYPARLGRDELADLLWPESEGDKAIRNLYDATKDLRRVIARIPGARLEVISGTGHLFFLERLDETVRLLEEFLDEA
jgi:pimeloyl-ACP methyl ester carboxylesterase